jgi:hypothetical protein
MKAHYWNTNTRKYSKQKTEKMEEPKTNMEQMHQI